MVGHSSQWFGYEYLDFCHYVTLSECGTRGINCKGQLAVEAAKAYAAFLKVSSLNDVCRIYAHPRL